MTVDFYAEATKIEDDMFGFGWIYWSAVLSALLRNVAPDDAALAEFDRWCADRADHLAGAIEAPADDPFWDRTSWRGTP